MWFSKKIDLFNQHLVHPVEKEATAFIGLELMYTDAKNLGRLTNNQ